jgi:hypothetical protein
MATLRITRDDLVPAEVTAALGCEPTRSWAKGDTVTSSQRPTPRTARFGMWSLEADDTAPADVDVDAQVNAILDRLTTDEMVWGRLRARYNVNLFCGWFMDRVNEGVCVEPETMSALGARGILLDVDLYGGPVDEPSE